MNPIEKFEYAILADPLAFLPYVYVISHLEERQESVVAKERDGKECACCINDVRCRTGRKGSRGQREKVNGNGKGVKNWMLKLKMALS